MQSEAIKIQESIQMTQTTLQRMRFYMDKVEEDLNLYKEKFETLLERKQTEGGVDFAAAVLNKAPSTIRKYVQTGQITRDKSKVGRRLWFKLEDLIMDQKLGFPDYEKRAAMELEGELKPGANEAE